jgi:hypothetical protein
MFPGIQEMNVNYSLIRVNPADYTEGETNPRTKEFCHLRLGIIYSSLFRPWRTPRSTLTIHFLPDTCNLHMDKQVADRVPGRSKDKQIDRKTGRWTNKGLTDSYGENQTDKLTNKRTCRCTDR